MLRLVHHLKLLKTVLSEMVNIYLEVFVKEVVTLDIDKSISQDCRKLPTSLDLKVIPSYADKSIEE